MSNHSHRKQSLHYCPNLGPHHMNWEARHFTSRGEHQLRYAGAFLLSLVEAPPPSHTLIHRSLAETPIPRQGEIEEILGAAAIGGLQAVISSIDTRTTEHYRQQLYIASIPTTEVIERLTSKQYVTQTELRGI